MKYDFARIEKKWQEKWEKTNVFAASEKSEGKKFYGLVEFPYPSGEGSTWGIRDRIRRWILWRAKSV